MELKQLNHLCRLAKLQSTAHTASRNSGDLLSLRGRTVTCADGKPFGVVRDLVVEATSGEPRYVDVRLNDNVCGLQSELNLWIPVGMVEAQEPDCLRVQHVGMPTLLRIPLYTENPFTRAYEVAVYHAFLEMSGEPPAMGHYGGPLYETEHLNNEAFYMPPITNTEGGAPYAATG